MNKQDFDVTAWFEDQGIEYATEGDNTTQGWANVACPFCADHANHLGVNLESKNFHCWLCGERGDVVKLIREVQGVGYYEARDVVNRYSNPAKQVVKEKPSSKPFRLPGHEMEEEIPEVVRKLFKRRNFPLAWIKRHRLRFYTPTQQLVVPVFYGGRAVSYQLMDVTGLARVKYQSCPKDAAVMDNKSVWYGVDEALRQDQVVVVEGVTDKWRVGDCAVAAFGKGVSEEQRRLFVRLFSGKRVKVFLDPDARSESFAFAGELALLGWRVQRVELGSGDPAELTEEEVRQILEM